MKAILKKIGDDSGSAPRTLDFVQAGACGLLGVQGLGETRFRRV